MLLSGLGGVFTADFNAARKRACASLSVYWSLFLVAMRGTVSDSKKTTTIELKADMIDFSIMEAKLTVHRALPADHDFYKLVGRVASEWAGLEHVLDLVIWELATWNVTGLSQPHVACITAQIMGVPGRCKAIVALGKLKGLDHKEILKPFLKLMQDSYAASEFRHRIVHDPWYMEDGSKNPGQFKAMPFSDQRYGIYDITQAEIDETISSIKALSERAGKLRSAVLHAMHSSG